MTTVTDKTQLKTQRRQQPGTPGLPGPPAGQAPAQAPASQAKPAARRRLVVIGNGMAGARAVEEILARGGAEQFTITMFGDEPYGNYNRIMLSHVLSGEESDADIFLNSLHWYQDNNITLHAGVRVERIDRFTKYVFANNGHVVPYDVLIIATGSQSFMPPMDGLYTPSGSIKPGVFTFRTIDDTRNMVQHAQHDHPPTQGRSHRGRPVGTGSGARAPKPRHRRRRGALRRAPHERPDGARRRSHPPPERGGPGHPGAHREPHHRRPGHGQGHRRAAAGPAGHRLRHGGGGRRDPPQRGHRRPQRTARGTRHRGG